jgi:hypothetical protein
MRQEALVSGICKARYAGRYICRFRLGHWPVDIADGRRR